LTSEYSDIDIGIKEIDGMIACKGWFCGHWHKDKYYYDVEMKREYRYLYSSTVVLKGDEVVSFNK
jgi:hypothetical protein